MTKKQIAKLIDWKEAVVRWENNLDPRKNDELSPPYAFWEVAELMEAQRQAAIEECLAALPKEMTFRDGGTIVFSDKVLSEVRNILTKLKDE